MGTASLLFLALAAAVGVVGCSSDAGVAASRSGPKRDLTPATRPAAHWPKFASPLELGQNRRHGMHLLSRKPKLVSQAAAPTIIPAAFTPAPITSSAAPPPAARSIPIPAEPANEHELPPGKTVTIIPASSGPSVAPAPDDQPAPESRRHSLGGGRAGGRGSCHGR